MHRVLVIDGALDRLRAHYVFPQVARDMDAYVRQQCDAGAYNAISMV